MKDYYAILGLPRNCNQADIKKAFRNLAKQHHPDKNNEENCCEFCEAHEAYETLSEDRKRKEYDKELHRSEFHNPTRTKQFSTYFSDHLFNDFPFFYFLRNHKQESFARSFDNFQESRNNLELILTPTEAKFGGKVPVAIPVQEICNVCNGRGMNGLWPCDYCDGTGVQNREYCVSLKYPPNVNHKETLGTFIEGFGYLTLQRHLI